MSPSDTAMQYSAVSRAIHWITVLLVVVLLWTGLVGEVEADKPGNATFMWHGSLGVLVLALVLTRIIWRIFGGSAPALPATMKGAERAIARAVHVGFYVLLVALPISGWLAASAEGASVNFFGVTTLPRLESVRQVPVATTTTADDEEEASENPAAEHRENLYEEVHEVLGYTILVLAILHLLAALKHHFIDRDDVLRTMLPVVKQRSGKQAH